VHATLPTILGVLAVIFDERDVRFEAFSSSGPGGQYKNRHANCVRAIHEPTGIRAIATKERKLGQNKKAALKALRGKIEAVRDAAIAKAASERRRNRPAAAFGSTYVRTYRLLQPASVVDHATGETFGVDVLNGRLDPVIRSRLSS
jgi:peptide chain release factor 1